MGDEFSDSFDLIFMLVGPKNVIENLNNNDYVNLLVWDLDKKEFVE